MLLRPVAILLVLTSAAPARAAEASGTPPPPWTTTVVHTAPAPTGAEAPRALSSQSIASPAATGLRGKEQAPAHALKGLASFYWQGEKTASGEPFDKTALTAAHPTLPFNTRVKVTHVSSGRSVVVRINDRGPFKPGRIIDVSQHAAEILGFIGRGLARVELEVLP